MQDTIGIAGMLAKRCFFLGRGEQGSLQALDTAQPVAVGRVRELLAETIC